MYYLGCDAHYMVTLSSLSHIETVRNNTCIIFCFSRVCVTQPSQTHTLLLSSCLDAINKPQMVHCSEDISNSTLLAFSSADKVMPVLWISQPPLKYHAFLSFDLLNPSNASFLCSVSNTAKYQVRVSHYGSLLLLKNRMIVWMYTTLILPFKSLWSAQCFQKESFNNVHIQPVPRFMCPAEGARY